MTMRRHWAWLCPALCLAMLATARPEAATLEDLRPALQAAIDEHLADRREAESITAISVHVDRGAAEPGLDLVAGTTDKGGRTAVTPATLFEIGSNTKVFTAVLALLLEAESRLSLGHTVGQWFPTAHSYPPFPTDPAPPPYYGAWSGVTLRRLFDMTSDIPNYSEAPAFQAAVAADPMRHWTPAELVAFADPEQGSRLGPTSGWAYSNTNYILAGMMIERAGKASYAEQLQSRIIGPLGLSETYYAPVELPADVRARMASGYFDNPDCGGYEPNCRQAALAPLIGRDMRDADVSWTAAAGGIVSTPRDLARWIRLLMTGQVLAPRQQSELTALVSTASAVPITDVSAEDPRGFALGLSRMFDPALGRFWFYEGETLGYRTVFAWFAEHDLVITASLNSQPAAAEDRIGALMGKLFGIVTAP